MHELNKWLIFWLTIWLKVKHKHRDDLLWLLKVSDIFRLRQTEISGHKTLFSVWTEISTPKMLFSV